jgi:uncharacterized phage protein (TIGR01671 family)
MREILFRGKPLGKLDEDFVYGSLGVISTDLVAIYQCEEYYEDIKTLVDIGTVGQYTGLTDKNGKKIFEGDIVHYLYEPGKGYWNSDQNSVIQWETTGFYMCGIMGTNKYACSSGWLVSTPHGDGNYFEVIGNIHDNPELLKGETNA